MLFFWVLGIAALAVGVWASLMLVLGFILECLDPTGERRPDSPILSTVGLPASGGWPSAASRARYLSSGGPGNGGMGGRPSDAAYERWMTAAYGPRIETGRLTNRSADQDEGGGVVSKRTRPAIVEGDEEWTIEAPVSRD